jgi:hypothetical protein
MMLKCPLLRVQARKMNCQRSIEYVKDCLERMRRQKQREMSVGVEKRFVMKDGAKGSENAV